MTEIEPIATGLLYPEPAFVGRRVSVTSLGVGTLKFFGPVSFSSEGGDWCGIALDDELGKNDGSVQDVQYFKCSDNHGVFLPLAANRVAMIDGGDISGILEEIRTEELAASKPKRKQYAQSRRNLKLIKQKEAAEKEKKLRHEHVKIIQAEIANRIVREQQEAIARDQQRKEDELHRQREERLRVQEEERLAKLRIEEEKRQRLLAEEQERQVCRLPHGCFCTQ